MENRFHFLKNPYFVERVFLEKPHQVKALAYVMILSVMIYALFECLTRKNMEQEKEPLDKVEDNRKSFRPTRLSALEQLDVIQAVRTEQDRETIWLLPKNQHLEVKHILHLLDMDSSILTQPLGAKAVKKANQ